MEEETHLERIAERLESELSHRFLDLQVSLDRLYSTVEQIRELLPTNQPPF